MEVICAEGEGGGAQSEMFFFKVEIRYLSEISYCRRNVLLPKMRIIFLQTECDVTELQRYNLKISCAVWIIFKQGEEWGVFLEFVAASF